jgi:hypothetical protein
MASAALVEWRTVRKARIDQLYDAHARMEGSAAPGRRWQTGQLNRLLVMAVAAEFQGFVRHLHDLSVDEFVTRTEFLGPQVSKVLRALLATDRAIDKGNPTPNGLGQDFGRFGLDLWPALRERDVRTTARHGQLERIIKARNGIAHADDQKIDQLTEEGYPMTLKTVKKWYSALNGLTDTMDTVLSDHIVVVHEGPRPW